MTPAAYFDIEVRGVAPARQGAKGFDAGAGLKAAPVMNRLIGILHGAFKERPSRYAVAFPALREGDGRNVGHMLRVFAPSRGDLDTLAENIENHPVVRDYLMIGRLRSIPTEYAGPWIEFRRFRVPSRSSGEIDNRRRALNDAQELPYLQVFSRSTGQPFSLIIQTLRHEIPLAGCPDSYGLSGPGHAFTVPDFPS